MFVYKPSLKILQTCLRHFHSMVFLSFYAMLHLNQIIGGDPTDGDGRDFSVSGYPQDEELLTPCAKLEKYALSESIFNRQMVPSILLEIFRDASADALSVDLPALMEIIAGIADDNEIAVRTDLVQRIPHLAAACAEFSYRVPALSNVVVDHLLPLVVKYLGDPDNQVRKSTHTTLLTLMEQGLVPQHAVEAQICPKVLHYTHSDSLMEYHTGAVTLMGKMVPLLGRETTERLFLQRFSELCSNPMFYIRKICASSFGEFCAVVGREAYENVLLPCFIELCADEIWGVRKACAEVVMTVSCASSPESRRTALAPAFARLLQDQSRWVRMSAFQTLGPFISTFADPSIIGLAYNQRGELVLINPAGTEFRINSPAFTDANLKAAADFKQRFYQAQELVNKNMFDNSYGLDNKYDYESDNVISIEEKENDSSPKNNLNATDSSTVQSADATNINSLENILSSSNNIQIVIGDVDRPKNDTNQNTTETESNCSGDYDIDIQKIIINVKETLHDLSDNLTKVVLEEEEEERKEDNSQIETNVGDGHVEIKKEADDELNKFNFYQYWHVSPDLPLDPEIVQSCGSPKKNGNEDNNFIHRLEDIHFNSSWNPEETICLDRKTWNEGREESLTSRLEHIEITQDIVPQFLIDHFVSMTDPDLAHNTDNDMAYHCAFSLPAVALTLGRNNWVLLKRTCHMLASDMQYKIRRTIASSLHELALILGQEMTAEHLLPIFDDFIKDLDEVRIGVLKHLAHFLKLIGPEKRNLYLPRLEKFLKTDNQWNWRFREELAEQLLLAVPLFTPIDASKHIAFLAQELLCDKVFAVRQVALSLVTELVRHVSGEPNLSSCLLLKLAEEFAHSKRWVRRQAFALLCSRLISKNALPPEQFATIVMPHLLDLSWDPVPNVRLAVSRTLARDIILHEYFADVNSEQHEPVNMVLRRLQSDKDRDVRQYAVPLVH